MNELLRRGPEILPGTWEYEWVASVVAKTEQYAGRSSHWNRKLYEQPGPISGICHEDGSMTLSREHVLEPARPAYTAGRSPTHDELLAASAATTHAVRQARLSLSDFGDDSVPGATPNGSLADIALEQALADRFTQEYVGPIGEDLAEHPLPQGGMPAFPAYTAATDRLMYPLAGATGLSTSRLRDLIERTERPQRFNVIVDRVLDHQIGDLIPESHRARLRQDLSAPLQRGLGGLAMTELSDFAHPGSKASWGERTAEWTDSEFSANLDDIKEHYESWHAQHPDVEPPELPESLRETFLDREEGIRQLWADAGWPAQQPVAGREHLYYENLPEQLYPTSREAQIAELQRFLWSGSAPGQTDGSRTGTGARPDNVRPIRSANNPDRGI